MAKDRTRHARRREPGRRQESPLDGVAREMARALDDLFDRTTDELVDFVDGTMRALAGLTDAVSGAVSACAETYRRLTDDSD